MGAIGVFEADANAGKLSAEAAANNGFELEKATDRAIFRAQERFGAYLANAKSRSEWDERWEEVKPQVIRVIAEVTTPTPGVLRRVGAALRPAKQERPTTSAKTAGTEVERRELADAHRDEVVPGSGWAVEPKDFSRQAAVTKVAWSYDASTKLWTSNDPMQKFACPSCGTEQHIGFSHCAGCDRQWNSWAVRQAGTDKTSASTYMLMAREIKMRGDQYKLAMQTKVADSSDADCSDMDDDDKGGDDDKMEKDSSTKVAGPGMMPMPGTMPGDNSGATGAPMAPAAAPAPGGPGAGPMPGANSPDGDNDVAGGITEGSPIDQIQDALEGAVMALKDVQMLSINPVLAKTASTKVAMLRTAMDRFWKLHKELNYVAGMLAKEASDAIKAADPRITSEAMFVQGFEAAAKNTPLPTNTSREYLEGYIAFHKQADAYSDGANTGGLFQPDPGQDATTGTRNDGSFLGDSGLDDATNNQSANAGPADGEAASNFASHMDSNNAAGQSRGDQGESSSIQPTGARRRR